MIKLTIDEKSLLIGLALSSLVSGVGIYQLIYALGSLTLENYIFGMITGAMLFNAWISGVTAIGAIWYNYQATL
jgi:hypothetical protein